MTRIGWKLSREKKSDKKKFILKLEKIYENQF